MRLVASGSELARTSVAPPDRQRTPEHCPNAPITVRDAEGTDMTAPVVLHLNNEPVLGPASRFVHAFSRLADDGLLVHVPAAPRALLNEGGRQHALREISRIARAVRPDLVFVQSPHAFPWEYQDASALLSSLGSPPVVYWEGDAWGGRKPLVRSTIAWLGHADHVFSVAVGAQAALLGRHTRTPVRYVPNVVPGPLTGGEEKGPPGMDVTTVDVAHIGNRCVRFGFLERLDGALDRQRLSRGLCSMRDRRVALYGHGWRGRAARGRVPFERQLDYMRDARITCGWNHYQGYTGYFSDRLPIAIYSGRTHVSSRSPGLGWLPGPDRGLHLCDTPAEAVSVIRGLLCRDPEELHAAAVRGHHWSRDRLSDLQALLYMLGDEMELPPPHDDPWRSIAELQQCALAPTARRA